MSLSLLLNHISFSYLLLKQGYLILRILGGSTVQTSHRKGVPRTPARQPRPCRPPNPQAPPPPGSPASGWGTGLWQKPLVRHARPLWRQAESPGGLPRPVPEVLGLPRSAIATSGQRQLLAGPRTQSAWTLCGAQPCISWAAAQWRH